MEGKCRSFERLSILGHGFLSMLSTCIFKKLFCIT